MVSALRLSPFFSFHSVLLGRLTNDSRGTLLDADPPWPQMIGE